MSEIVNVGLRLSETARLNPDGIAVAMPRGRDAAGKRIYESRTFRELDDDTNLLADGLASMDVRPGMRLVLMVPPSIDFIALVFAMFKAVRRGRRIFWRTIAIQESGTSRTIGSQTTLISGLTFRSRFTSSPFDGRAGSKR